MARCEECLHYEVCAKEGRLVQVDEHTWDEYNKLDDVEQFCTNYFTADVVPKSEVERLVDKWIGEENLTQDEKTLRLIEALRDEAKRYERYYYNHEYDKLIAEANQKLASEIFAEIEIVLCCSVYPRVNANGTITPISSKDWHIRCDDYNAIKKKYTEREK